MHLDLEQKLDKPTTVSYAENKRRVFLTYHTIGMAAISSSDSVFHLPHRKDERRKIVGQKEKSTAYLAYL